MPETLREELLEDYDLMGIEEYDYGTDYAFTFAVEGIDAEQAQEIMERLREELNGVNVESAAIRY